MPQPFNFSYLWIFEWLKYWSGQLCLACERFPIPIFSSKSIVNLCNLIAYMNVYILTVASLPRAVAELHNPFLSGTCSLQRHKSWGHHHSLPGHWYKQPAAPRGSNSIGKLAAGQGGESSGAFQGRKGAGYQWQKHTPEPILPFFQPAPLLPILRHLPAK